MGVVLAAGQGRRMGEISAIWPKPLLTILNVPIILWSLTQLREAGVSRAWANIGHLAGKMRASQASLERASGVTLRLVEEHALTGPAGGLLACLRRCPSAEHVLIVHGDVFAADGLTGLLESHLAARPDVTMLVTPVPDPWRFGAVMTRDGLLTGWAEKSPDTPAGALVNAGAYVFGRRACEASLGYTRADNCDFKDLLPWLAAADLTVRVHVTIGLWSDIGTPTSLVALNVRLLDRADWRARAAELALERLFRDAHGNWLAESAHVGRGVLRRVIVGPGAWIGGDCELTECVILPGAAVAHGTIARSMVLW